MDEQQWLNSDDARGMTFYLREEQRAARTKAGRRKLTLFQTACFRLIWDARPPEARRVIEGLEQDADCQPIEGGMNALHALAVQWVPTARNRRADHYAAFGLLQAVSRLSPAKAADRVSLYVE